MAHDTHARHTPTRFPPSWARRPLSMAGGRARLMVAGIFAVVAAVLAFLDQSIDHVLRAWVLGLMLTFGWTVGGLALLMVQYCSGGKWGLLLRRPLEA